MLKNRKIELKFVRDEPGRPGLNEPAQEPLNITATVTEVTETLVQGTVQVMGAYMALDTIRKIAIHKFTR